MKNIYFIFYILSFTMCNSFSPIDKLKLKISKNPNINQINKKSAVKIVNKWKFQKSNKNRTVELNKLIRDFTGDNIFIITFNLKNNPDSLLINKIDNDNIYFVNYYNNYNTDNSKLMEQYYYIIIKCKLIPYFSLLKVKETNSSAYKFYLDGIFNDLTDSNIDENVLKFQNYLEYLNTIKKKKN